MPDSKQPVRWTTLFEGTVQGVGFRYTTERVAGRFAVSGYVRNLVDGRVEVVAEGTEDELRRFIEAVTEAMSGYVRDYQVDRRPGTGQFSGFSLRF